VAVAAVAVAVVVAVVAAAAAVPDTSPLLLPGNQVQQSITEHDEHHRNVCKYQFCGPVEKVAPLEYDLYPVGMPSVDYPDALEVSGGSSSSSSSSGGSCSSMPRCSIAVQRVVRHSSYYYHLTLTLILTLTLTLTLTLP